MSDSLDRRAVLKGVAVSAVAAACASAKISADAAADLPGGLRFGPAAPFSFDSLKRHAQELVAGPDAAPPQLDDAQALAMNYDEMGRIKHRFNAGVP